MDVAFLCSSTPPITAPGEREDAAAVSVAGKERQEENEQRQLPCTVAEPPPGFDPVEEDVEDRPNQPRTCTARYGHPTSKNVELVPPPQLCPPQLPSRAEGQNSFAAPPFPHAPLRGPSFRKDFDQVSVDAEPAQQWPARNFGVNQLPAAPLSLQPRLALLHSAGKPRDNLPPTFPPLQSYSFNFGGKLCCTPQQCAPADMHIGLHHTQHEATALYPYGHKQQEQQFGYLPFPSPQTYYQAPPDYRHGAEEDADSVGAPGRTQNLPSSSSALAADCDRLYENCTAIARFAVEMGVRARRTNSLPLPLLAEFEVRDLMLRAHDIIRTMAAIGNWPALVGPAKSSPATMPDGGVVRDSEQDKVAAIGAATERGNQPKQKYRKRRKGGDAGGTGRCHSCNVSETPEWRRGPDGARTLCNACGLHFAKLRRKQALSEMKHLEETKLETNDPSPKAIDISVACCATGAEKGGGSEACPNTARRPSVTTSTSPSACPVVGKAGIDVARSDGTELDDETAKVVPFPCKPGRSPPPDVQEQLGAVSAGIVR